MTEVGEILLKGTVFLVTAAVILTVILFVAGGYHFVSEPTPDQLYGCTLKQQMPDGDCP